MPKISTFMYCEKAEPNPQGKLNISNPLLVINPVFIPGLFSFAFVCGVVGMNMEKQHTIRVAFLTPDENEQPLVDTGAITISAEAAPKPKVALPPEQQGMVFNLDFRNVVFKTEGTYKTHVYVDGDLLGEYPIYVQVGEEQ